MRYIKLKQRKAHGNCSWRRTGYTEVISGGKSDRDVIVAMRLQESLEKRRLYNLWKGDRVDTSKVFPDTIRELRAKKWRV